MANIDLVNLSAVEMVRLVRAKDITAKELMEAHLLQIERVNPKVNAIVTLLPDLAIEKAEETDLAIARGEDVGILQGLPVAHKDLVPTKGIRTTFGSPIYEHNVPDHNALIVDRIQQAGAITIGKTNTPEYGQAGTSDNRVFGSTYNPWNKKMTSGGSSGGSAVSVSSGITSIGQGGDGGGSIRIPASFCGVYGIKPTQGRISRIVEGNVRLSLIHI